MSEATIIERVVSSDRTGRTTSSHSNGSSNERKTFVEADVAKWEEEDYSRLLAEFESLFNTPRGSTNSARYEALADLIEAYEESHYPMREP